MPIRPLGPGLIALALGAQAQVAEPAAIPPARWERDAAVLEVTLAAPAGVAAQTLPAPLHYAIGIVALPFAAVEPVAALAWPFYVLLGAPWQAGFNHQSATVSRALAATPLPQALAAAFGAQGTAGAGRPPFELQVRIASYGFTTRSGRALEAFEPQEDLCLAASAQWTLARPGRPAQTQALLLSTGGRDADAPPPICLPLARWAADDGRRVRQAVTELGEVLAALLWRRLETAP